MVICMPIKLSPRLNVYKILPPGLTIYFIYCFAKNSFEMARYEFATETTIHGRSKPG